MPTVDGGRNLLLGTDRTGAYQIGVRLFRDAADVQREHLIIWHAGAAQLGPELDTTGSELTAVSPSGVAVGLRRRDDRTVALAYAYGQLIELASPAGTNTIAVAANSRGQVAGGIEDGDGGALRAVLRWSPDGTARQLPMPAGYRDAEVKEIDEDGTVLGVVTNDRVMGSDARIAVWGPDGTPRILVGTEPDDQFVIYGAIAVRDGKVTGTRFASTGSETLRWDLGGGTPRVLDTDGAIVQAANAGGSLLLENGPLLLPDGTERPLVAPGGLRLDPRGLSDADIVYGNENSTDSNPAYFDCAA